MLRRKGLAIDIGIARFRLKYLAVAFGLLIVLLVLTHVINLAATALHVTFDTSRNAASFSSTSWGQLLLVIITAGVLTAWLEEWLFRGFMFDAMQKATSPLVAAVIVSLIFAIVHWDIPEIPFLFVISLSLCWLRKTSGSLFPGMIVHALFNATIVAAAYIGIAL